MSVFTEILSAILLLGLCLPASSHKLNFALQKKALTFEDHLQLVEVIKNQDEQSTSPSYDFKLENYKNSQYIGTIYIGSNQQPFDVVFDTGSHFLVVPTNTMNGQFSNIFDCETSTTCTPYEDQRVSLSYGSGKGRGYVAEDQISLGNGLTAQTTFVAATLLGRLPSEFHAEGILGLREVRDLENYFSYPNADTIAQTKYSFIDNLYTQGVIANKQFSFFLNDIDASTRGALGADFTLGGYNPEYIQNNFTYMDVVDGNYWAVRVNGLNFGKTQIKIDRNTKAVIDTGTSVITFPMDIYNLFVKAILQTTKCQSIKKILCVCGNRPCGVKPEDFPTITLQFDNMKAVLPGRSYVSNIEGYSVLDIMGLDMGSDEQLIILGDPFMRQYVALFDAAEDTIGLAESINYNVPVKQDDRQMMFIILSVVSVLLLSVLTISCWKIYNKKGEDNIRLLRSSQNQGIAMTDVNQQAI